VSAGLPYTPANMVASIKTKPGYQTGVYIPYDSRYTGVFHCANGYQWTFTLYNPLIVNGSLPMFIENYE
jgi:hypothetical protein